MEYRNYDPKRDKDAIHRIWREAGWIEKGKEEAMDLWIGCSRVFVADINGEAECSALTTLGTIRYLNEELPFSFVAGVTTGKIARKQGLARRLSAMIVATDAAEGTLVLGLGMFEQRDTIIGSASAPEAMSIGSPSILRGSTSR